MNKIMVLGGGADQIDLLLNLKKRGFYTILIDYNENPVAKPYADIHVQKSTLDQNVVLKLAEESNIDGIITTNTDQALLTVAYVANKLNLPHQFSYEQARNITNKLYMKEVMVQNGISTAPFVKIISGNEDISRLRFPIIVKPADCNSSKGVNKVSDINSYKSFLNYAITLSRSHTAIVEEFIDGREISVDAYVTPTGVKILMTGELRKASVNSSGKVIYQNIIPADISEVIKGKINRTAQKISTAFNLSNTPLLIQAIIRNDDIYVIEFSARLGGGGKHRTINKFTGFDVLNANIDSIFGIFPEINISPFKGLLSRIHIYLKPGIFASIEGIDDLISEGLINEYIQNKVPGTEFKYPNASTDRLGSFLISAPDAISLENKISYIMSRIHVFDKSNKDMILREIYTTRSNEF